MRIKKQRALLTNRLLGKNLQAGGLFMCVSLPAIHFIPLQNELPPLSGPALLSLARCPLPVCAAVVYC